MQSLIFLIIVAYFFLIFFISRIAGGYGGNDDNFFTAGRNSRWYVVAGGMISASISGISIVSVPGMVGSSGFTYMQMVIGFFFGYCVITRVLLPLYYRLDLTSIYEYLGLRFGPCSHRVGAIFFILFKFVSATSRLYVVLLVLQFYIFDSWHVPFHFSAVGFILFIFIYTFRSGIKTLVWTDFFQTVCMLGAVASLIYCVMSSLDMDCLQVYDAVVHSDNFRVFVFDDFISRNNFFKQFVSGIFVVVVMTGLDQDVMQKNLSCRNLHESRKNMLTYGACFIPVNLMFLTLGSLLLILAQQECITLPLVSDHILPFFAMNYYGGAVSILFVVALLAAAFSSADSALVSLTTSVSVDLLGLKDKNISIRKRVLIHSSICVVFIFVMLLFRLVNNQSALDAIYTIVSYLYGPLLGMFAFGIFSKCSVRDRYVPYVAILSPILCFAINQCTLYLYDYRFGYELLMLNGLVTIVGLYMLRIKGKTVVV